MKRIAILGSTGSIGKSSLQVARHLGSKVKVVALAAHSNIDLLEQQVHEFAPVIVGVYDKEKARELQKRIPNTTVVGGMEGLEAVSSYHDVNFVISAITGTLGLIPTVTAIKAGKNIALANKEALVSGGSLVMSLVREKGVQLIPIDSEHSALHQCLHGEKTETVQRLILTASGGPFRSYNNEQLREVTVDHALQHPTWKMGPKVTIDCSTLMNKGLEVIEAHWLFGIPIDNINVVIHPQSLIHSMVEFVDNSVMAQINENNMMIPIQYALTHPERVPGMFPKFDFVKYGTLQFFAPDMHRFRCLKLAYHAIRTGGTLPCYMNAANEILVNRCLERNISWHDISTKLERLMERHQTKPITRLDDVLAIDQQAREEAQKT